MTHNYVTEQRTVQYLPVLSLTHRFNTLGYVSLSATKTRIPHHSNRCQLNMQHCQTNLKHVRFQVLTAANMKFRVFGKYCRVVKSMSTDVSEVRAASIVRPRTNRRNSRRNMG